MIDVHHHVIPEELQGKHNFPKWSISSDLEAMERLGITGALLSIPAYSNAEDVRRMNDRLAEMVNFKPTVYGMLCTLPCADAQNAILEISYCMDNLKADGFILLSNYNGKYIGDDEFDPILSELNSRAAVVLLHPTIPPKLPSGLWISDPSVYEFPFDTTRAIMDLIYRDKLKLYPNIRWIISHAGGTIPFLAYRLSIGKEWNAIGQNPEDIITALKTLYYDLALSTSSAVFRSLNELVSTDQQILFGTDFPLRYEKGVQESIRQLNGFADYNTEAQLNISTQNAQRLFPRFQTQ